MPQNVFYKIESPVCFHRNSEVPTVYRPYVSTCHYHDAYEVYLFLEGNVAMYVNGSYHKMVPGDLYILPPNCPHGAVCYDAQVYDRLILNIHEELLMELSGKGTDLTTFLKGEDKEQVKHITLDGETRKRYIRLVEEMKATFDMQSEFGAELEARARLTLFFVFLNRILSKQKIQNEDKVTPVLVANIIEYIGEHLTEPITLEILSTRFFNSGKYISNVFRRCMGMTLRTYIITQRVERAKKLLIEGKNVSEVCEFSGFGDYSNFIRTFTRMTGVSPGKYGKHYNLKSSKS